jgi:hypothetical protein
LNNTNERSAPKLIACWSCGKIIEQSNDPVTQKVICFELGTNIEHTCPNSYCELTNDEYRPIFENSYDLFIEKRNSKLLNIIQRLVEIYNTYIAERDSEKIPFKIIQGDA